MSDTIETEVHVNSNVNKTVELERNRRDRKAEIIRELIDSLIGAVDPDSDHGDEYRILGGIINRAGLGWRCISQQCACINHNNTVTCDVCGRRKPKVREVPEPEDMSGLYLYRKSKNNKLQEQQEDQSE